MNKFIKTVTLAVLALATSLAFAISSPKEIEADLANHNYSQARAKVEAVIAEKPTSARAHLLKAFLLVHVDNDAAGAASELKLVQQYDKTGDTTSSPLFNRVEGEIKTIMHPVVAHTQETPPAVTPVVDNSPFIILYIFIGVIVLGFIVMGYVIFKSTQTPRPLYNRPADTENRFSSNYSKPTSPSAADVSTSKVGVSPSKPWREERERVVYRDNPVVPAYQPPVQSQGMGMMGTAASVAGGVLAGELLHDVLTDKPEKKKKRDVEESKSDDSYLFSSSRSESSYSRSTPSYTQDEPSTRSSSSSSSSWGSDSSSSYSSSSSDSYSSSSDSSSSSSDW
jgi:hypothetical protein